MTKTQIRKAINKKICGLSKGFFEDDSWHGVNIISKALCELENELNVDVTLHKAEYEHEEGIAVRKRYMYAVTNDKGQEVFVHIIASGAGNINDPLSKYDISAYAI